MVLSALTATGRKRSGWWEKAGAERLKSPVSSFDLSNLVQERFDCRAESSPNVLPVPGLARR